MARKERISEERKNLIREFINQNNIEDKQNYRNGYGTKNIHSSAGDFEIKVPRDRNGEFDPVIVEKGNNDISNIEQKIRRMYARGNSNKEIYEQMKELYGVHISPDMVTSIINKIIPKIKEWQNRPLEKYIQ